MEHIPITLNPKLTKAIENLCRNAVTYSRNHGEVRKSVANLILLLDQCNGELKVEVANLRRFLRRTDPNFDFSSIGQEEGRPALQSDPISVLGEENKALAPEQIDAALSIKRIWTSFGKYLSVAARDLNGSGYKGRGLDPISVMSDDVAYQWREIYCPWYEQAKKTYIGRSGVNYGEITLSVVVEAVFPDRLDKKFRLREGQALSALQSALTQYANMS